MHAKLVTGAMLIAMSALLQPASAAPDWQTIAKALGESGTETPDGVYRVGLPRTDLKVSLDGVAL
ncbi:peptidase M23, partial [Mesorhizobium sp. M0323]